MVVGSITETPPRPWLATKKTDPSGESLTSSGQPLTSSLPTACRRFGSKRSFSPALRDQAPARLSSGFERGFMGSIETAAGASSPLRRHEETGDRRIEITLYRCVVVGVAATAHAGEQPGLAFSEP
jgi:hypothetical protein